MAINYPVDVENDRFTVVEVEADGVTVKEVTRRGARWPRADGMPLEVEPGITTRYLLESRDETPEFDPDYYFIVQTEVLDVPDQSAHTQLTTEKHTQEQIDEHIENEELRQTGRWFRTIREFVETRLALAGIIALEQGDPLPPDLYDHLRDYKEVGISLWKNRKHVQDLYAETRTGAEPDLQAGWEDPANPSGGRWRG